jgi:hypothetical protein
MWGERRREVKKRARKKLRDVGEVGKMAYNSLAHSALCASHHFASINDVREDQPMLGKPCRMLGEPCRMLGEPCRWVVWKRFRVWAGADRLFGA